MEHKQIQVLVLGCRGMLGRVVLTYLKKDPQLRVLGTHHRPSQSELKFRVEAKEKDFQSIIYNFGQPDWIINCIGKLRSVQTDNDNLERVNTTLPVWLDKLVTNSSEHLIHISTDAVFPALAGPVDELAKTDPEDKYGQTKLKGEPKSAQALTIRTSIIGFDPKHQRGLLEWVKKESTKTINGYLNQLWAGSTVLETAKLIGYLIKLDHFLTLRTKTPVVHFAPHGPMTKAELVNKILGLVKPQATQVNPVQAPIQISRYLITRYKKLLPTALFSASIDEPLKELQKFEQKEMKV